jgi:hypothetical protein
MAWRTRGAQRDRRDTLSRVAGFNGNFASLFTPGTVLQSVQTDLGLTYGGTPLATAGNTSTTVLTLSGTLTTVPVPIWAKATNTLAIGAGATFSVYYDGLGVTPAMTGVTPTAGVGVALTGAATGLTLTWAAGTSVNNDSWKATCSALADQSGNGFHYTMAILSQQPLIAAGNNGFAQLSFDGVNDCLQSTGPNLPLPGTTPSCLLAVYAPLAFTAGINTHFNAINNAVNACCVAVNSAAVLSSICGSTVNIAFVAGTQARLRVDWSSSAGDILRLGATQTTGNAGNSSDVTGRSIGCTLSGGRAAAMNLTQALYLNHIPSAGEMTAFESAVISKYGIGIAL